VVVLTCSSGTLAVKLTSDFVLSGYVENVFYRDTANTNVGEKIQCYLAIHADNKTEKDNIYNACLRVETCKFAERAMFHNMKVELLGRNRETVHNADEVVGLHLSGKKAKFWE
ncbi:hypothetical protein U1Q18_052087, partial [Sarracenia purpurea var. burkii]